MNKTIIFLYLLCVIDCFSQDNFNEAIIQLQNDYQYFSEYDDNGKLYLIKDSIDTRLKKSIQRCSKYDKRLKDLDFKDLKSVKTTHVKSKKPLENNIYLRIQIQEWGFHSINEAKKFEDKLNRVTQRSSIECINKGGLIWWSRNNRMYVIISNAYRFSFEFDKIKESLNKKL